MDLIYVWMKRNILTLKECLSFYGKKRAFLSKFRCYFWILLGVKLNGGKYILTNIDDYVEVHASGLTNLGGEENTPGYYAYVVSKNWFKPGYGVAEIS